MITKIKPNKISSSSGKSNNLCAVDLLSQYCKDIDHWADSWEIDALDIKIGQDIVEQFKLFLIDRIGKGRAKKTIKMNGHYLWALGGELISRLNQDAAERKLSARKLILKYIDESGGPYWRHANDEVEHGKYDTVCKQFFRFMMDNPS